MNVLNWVSLRHLDRLTDGTGLIQHARFGAPRRESGYTTDDNARALRLCARLFRQANDDPMLDRVTKYLAFLEHAFCEDGRCHNFMSYDRRWLDEASGGDCLGQAVRALAEVMASPLPEGHRELARELLEGAVRALGEGEFLREGAYTIMAYHCLWKSGAGGHERLERCARSAAQHLARAFAGAASSDWPWFERSLTYANAVLPHALMLAGERWPGEDFDRIATASFEFLARVTTSGDVFSPVGNAGWYPRGGVKALYDQQPLEAATMGEAALDAHRLCHNNDGEGAAYLKAFRRSLAWFHGRNSRNRPLADPDSGACCDGLLPNGINGNQGAESTLAYLWLRELEFENRRLFTESVDGDAPQRRSARLLRR